MYLPRQRGHSQAIRSTPTASPHPAHHREAPSRPPRPRPRSHLVLLVLPLPHGGGSALGPSGTRLSPGPAEPPCARTAAAVAPFRCGCGGERPRCGNRGGGRRSGAGPACGGRETLRGGGGGRWVPSCCPPAGWSARIERTRGLSAVWRRARSPVLDAQLNLVLFQFWR